MQIIQKNRSTALPSEPTKRGTQRQAIFRYIIKTLCVEGLAPTSSDIQRAFHIGSSGTVHYHLEQLKARGWLKRASGKWRNLALPAFSTTSQEPESALKLHSTLFQSLPGCLNLEVCNQVYISDHLCTGDVITVTTGVSITGHLLAVLRCPLQSHPSLTLVQIQKQNADTISLRLVEHGNSPQAYLQLSAEEWHRDWVVLGAITSVFRSL